MTRIVNTWLEPNAMWSGMSGNCYDTHNEILSNYKWGEQQEVVILMKGLTQDIMVGYGEDAIKYKIMLLDEEVFWVGSSTLTNIKEGLDVPIAYM